MFGTREHRSVLPAAERGAHEAAAAAVSDGHVARARLTASVAQARAELDSTLAELRGAMRRQLDWRAWVARQPLWAVAVAAFVGFRLGRGRHR